jgi:6,7-dimethyl-8-ribityllumazine synthase
MPLFEGKLDAKGFKFAIVASRFNSFITDKMVEGALDVLLRHNASQSDIDVVKVPGSFEIPLGVKTAVSLNKYDAIIAIGAIIRGETSHFDYLASQVTKELSSLSLQSGVPVTSGVVTTETLEQAIERAGGKAGNRGSEAAFSAIEMVNLMKQLSRKK